MGGTYATVELENLFANRVMEVAARVDSSAVFLSIPEHIAVQLGFDTTEVATREVVLTNGHRQEVPMIGPLRVRFGDRYCDLSALVLGDEPLLGSVPMQMMDLVLHPATRIPSINPESPDVPSAHAK